MTGVDEPVHLQFDALVEARVQRVPTRARAGQSGRFDLAERRVGTGQQHVSFDRDVAHCNILRKTGR